MKKFFMCFAIMLAMVSNVMAQYGPTKFTDNVSVEVKGGVTTPMNDFYGGVSPVVGVQVDKYITPWLGFGVDVNALIANPYGSANPHTAFDLVNINGLTKFNIRNMWKYDGTRKFFEPVVFAGLGWGHRTCDEFIHKNYMVFKSGVEMNFALDKNKAWAARVTPAVVWGPASDLKLNKYNGAFELTVGIVYRFKNKDGNRHYTKVRVYDQVEIDTLNQRINNLKAQNRNITAYNSKLKSILEETHNRKPKIIKIERVDTVMLMPNIQFKQNSKYLDPTSEATVVKMAEYMKTNPNKVYTLIGYASAEGPNNYNEELSLARAATLRVKLIGYGVNPNNLNVVGRGETDKFSKEIRGLNRIVVIEE